MLIYFGYVKCNTMKFIKNTRGDDDPVMKLVTAVAALAMMFFAIIALAKYVVMP